VLVEVSDTGTGIPPDIIDKVFEPFFSTKEVGKGTGLGLSTVYGIVKQTGGFVYADSAPGNTAFRIFLPRHIPGAEDALTQIPAADAPAIAGAISAADSMARAAAADLTGHGTILLVEDEEGLRALNARGLASRGYTVLAASGGAEALQLAAQRQGVIHALITDVIMPGMSGHDRERRSGGVGRSDARNGRADAAQGTASSRPGSEDYLRVGLCRGSIPEKSPRRGEIRISGKAVHAQATRVKSERDAGGVTRRVSNRAPRLSQARQLQDCARRVFSNTRTCSRQGKIRPAANGVCGARK